MKNSVFFLFFGFFSACTVLPRTEIWVQTWWSQPVLIEHEEIYVSSRDQMPFGQKLCIVGLTLAGSIGLAWALRSLLSDQQLEALDRTLLWADILVRIAEFLKGSDRKAPIKITHRRTIYW